MTLNKTDGLTISHSLFNQSPLIAKPQSMGIDCPFRYNYSFHLYLLFKHHWKRLPAVDSLYCDFALVRAHNPAKHPLGIHGNSASDV